MAKTAAAEKAEADKLEHEGKGFFARVSGRVLAIPPIRLLASVFGIYNQAGGSLLAEGLASSALFAGLTGLLFSVGVLGYLVPSPGDRQRIVETFTGQFAALAPFVNDALSSLASNAGAFSIVGLIGMGWGASHFYGVLDQAIGRVFALTPARGTVDRILRGVVSVLLLVGGLLSGIALFAVQRRISESIQIGPAGDLARTVDNVAFPILTAVAIVVVIGIVYRIVPNTNVPIRVLRWPAVVAGLALTVLTELLVYIAPLLTGSLSLFGGVAAVFVALAWLHLAFQVVLIGAAWTRVRLEAAEAPVAGL